MKGNGFGLVGDIRVGRLGPIIASCLLPVAIAWRRLDAVSPMTLKSNEFGTLGRPELESGYERAPTEAGTDGALDSRVGRIRH
jgi:hypothetical protein